jgi:hypothetical protein
MGPVTTQFARIDPGPSQHFGGPGALISLVGAAMAVVAFLGADWFAGSTPAQGARFHEVHKVLQLPELKRHATGIASAYFSWLAWALLVAALLAAWVAAVPTLGRAFRVVAPAVCVVAIGLTLAAIRLFSGVSDFGSYWDALKNARIGFYLALAGFLVIGLGGAIGTRRSVR